ncbi:MAG TPA: IS200/IS605 family transposase [Phycisphaerae bacterium]|nr:IS200/IS605 family transposase [Phycisphaerales bacterium]HRX85270.1 IS200/IS605 family transposase [Phycisphaerae bacterium]
MSQSLCNILVHIVFSTKDRYPFLRDEVRPELHAYGATVLKNDNCPTLLMNSMSDHVHILCALSKNLAVCKLIKQFKVTTSEWIKTKGGMLTKFHWQSGYGAFSVSQSNVPAVRQYIAEQENHHKRMTFQDEFRALLRKHQVEFDERYVWD